MIDISGSIQSVASSGFEEPEASDDFSAAPTSEAQEGDSDIQEPQETFPEPEDFESNDDFEAPTEDSFEPSVAGIEPFDDSMQQTADPQYPAEEVHDESLIEDASAEDIPDSDGFDYFPNPDQADQNGQGFDEDVATADPISAPLDGSEDQEVGNLASEPASFEPENYEMDGAADINTEASVVGEEAPMSSTDANDEYDKTEVIRQDESTVVVSRADTSAVDITEFANSEASNLDEGELVYNLDIRGIDSKDLREAVKLTLLDPKLALDPVDTMRTLKNGRLMIAEVSPLKAKRLVEQLQFLDLDILWRQKRVIIEDGAPEFEDGADEPVEENENF